MYFIVFASAGKIEWREMVESIISNSILIVRKILAFRKRKSKKTIAKAEGAGKHSMMEYSIVDLFLKTVVRSQADLTLEITRESITNVQLSIIQRVVLKKCKITPYIHPFNT
jgi:hypothetical protein